MNIKQIQKTFIITFKSFVQVVPIIIGVILLVSMSLVFIPANFYANLFSGRSFLDPFLGALTGSVLIGNPSISYIIGGELLGQGVSLMAVIAFLVSWVSVGIVQFPAESMILGKKFALVRNSVNFIIALIIASISVFTLSVL